jgi:hypothetical protein
LSTRKTAAYGQNVFINCPFDDEYTPIFEAIVFTIFTCGFRPLCARERLNSAEVRLDKLVELIRRSKYSIHDLSRTTPDAGTGNPRFNMPFELGLDLGCRPFNRAYGDKCALIFAADRFEYQKFLSDIAGQDIKDHQSQIRRAIAGCPQLSRPRIVSLLRPARLRSNVATRPSAQTSRISFAKPDRSRRDGVQRPHLAVRRWTETLS